MFRHGGARPGAGRPKTGTAGVSHLTRPTHAARHPLHVTLRVLPHVYSLRSRRSFRVIERALLRNQALPGARVVHYSVQGNHLHLIVEAADRHALARRMQGFEIRVARGLNKMMRRRGKVFADRYHARELKTPREVRNARRYVLANQAHHARARGEPSPHVDPFSSGAKPSLVEPARTWLLSVGWRRARAP